MGGAKSAPPHRYDDESRRPDWAWETAQYYAGRGDVRHMNLPHHVRRAIKFLLRESRLSNNRSGDTLEKLQNDYYDIYHASILVSQGTATRYRVEASFLANFDYEELYKLTGVPVAVLATYHDLFFDVRNRLHYAGFIQSVIEDTVETPGLLPDCQVAWKKIGYVGGKVLLNKVIDALPMTEPEVAKLRELTMGQVARTTCVASLNRFHRFREKQALMTEFTGIGQLEVNQRQADAMGRQAVDAVTASSLASVIRGSADYFLSEAEARPLGKDEFSSRLLAAHAAEQPIDTTKDPALSAAEPAPAVAEPVEKI